MPSTPRQRRRDDPLLVLVGGSDDDAVTCALHLRESLEPTCAQRREHGGVAGPSAVLRDFEPADQCGVRDLILSGLGEHWGHIDPTLNPDLDDIATSYRDGRTVVAEMAGTILGCGSLLPLGPGIAEIVRVSVEPSMRNRGIGRQVVDELLRTARHWRLERVVLESTADWTEVVSFWQRCGFAITHYEQGQFSRDARFEYTL